MVKRNLPRTAFKKGQSGNPGGKMPGCLNRSTRVVLELMEGQLEQITRVCIQQALEGNMLAVKLILERVCAPVRERPLNIALPSVATIEGIAEAQAEVVRAVAVGDLLPGEGTALATILEARRKALETQELEARIVALEAASNADKT